MRSAHFEDVVLEHENVVTTDLVGRHRSKCGCCIESGGKTTVERERRAPGSGELTGSSQRAHQPDTVRRPSSPPTCACPPYNSPGELPACPDPSTSAVGTLISRHLSLSDFHDDGLPSAGRALVSPRRRLHRRPLDPTRKRKPGSRVSTRRTAHRRPDDHSRHVSSLRPRPTRALFHLRPHPMLTSPHAVLLSKPHAAADDVLSPPTSRRISQSQRDGS